eukprot:GFUD01020201.1.p1 GENE.GFUD01020201.1~~GFUD01020201.1.p1  ORF type:complete len:418 (+),score=85.94 GFUD01020201.1:366-1619(+)
MGDRSDSVEMVNLVSGGKLTQVKVPRSRGADRVSVTELFMIFVVDVVLALIKTYLEVNLVRHFFEEDHFSYGCITLAIMLLPGTLEFLTYTWFKCCGPDPMAWRTYLWWVGFSLIFPVSLPLWHMCHLLRHMCTCKGPRTHFNKYGILARSKVLNSLAHLTKGPLQLVFQTSILMIEWSQHDDDAVYHIYQPLVMAINVLMLSKSQVDQFFFVVSGKDLNAVAPVRDTLNRYLTTIFHVVIRGFIISLLAIYMKLYALIPLALLTIFNFLAAKIILKTHIDKVIFTTFAAIAVPTCFISRDTILASSDSTKGPRLWRKFAKTNSIIFFFTVLMAFVATDILLVMTDQLQFDENNMAFTSYNWEKQYPRNSIIPTIVEDYPWIKLIILGEPSTHSFFFLLQPVLLPAVILDTIIVYYE